MFDTKFFEELSQKLADAVPGPLSAVCSDLDKTFHTILQGAFSKLDLVTREEFDAQVAVLQRTSKKVDEMEKQLKAKGAAKKAQPKGASPKKKPKNWRTS